MKPCRLYATDVTPGSALTPGIFSRRAHARARLLAALSPGWHRWPMWLTVLALFAAIEAQATKMTGPFEAEARFEGNHATVTVRALSAATDVEVQVYGSDGLVVIGSETRGPTPARLFHYDKVAANDRLTLEVDVTPGPGQSYLAIVVTCAGQPPLVRGFAVGQLSEAQIRARAAGTQIDPDGQPVKVLNPDPEPTGASAGPVSTPPAWLGFPIGVDATFDAQHTRAHVTVTTTAPGTDIVVKVYGLDGMVVTDGRREGELLVRTEHRAALKPGEKVEIDVTVRPGEGQSMLTVAAQGVGIGSVVRSFPVGAWSESQRREHQRGVSVDPDGVPIRILGQ